MKEAPSSEVIAGGGREGCEKEKEEKREREKKKLIHVLLLVHKHMHVGLESPNPCSE